MHNIYAKIQKPREVAKFILTFPRPGILTSIASKVWKPTYIPFAKARKRIETDISQSVRQFMLNQNYAKQPQGLFARVISKVASFSALQYVNYLLGRPIGHVKYALH